MAKMLLVFTLFILTAVFSQNLHKIQNTELNLIGKN